MATLALLAWGSHGDVLPLVALAQGLTAAGHEVVLAAQPYHGEFVRAQGVAFHALGGATSAAHYDQLMARLIDEANPRKQLRELLHTLLLPDLEAQYQDALAVVAGADLVLAHWLQLAGMAAAERLGRPCLGLSLNPLGLVVSGATSEATSEAASETKSEAASDTARVAPAARNLGRRLADAIWGDDFQQLRARHGLPAIASVSAYQYAQPRHLLAISPALLEAHERLPDNCRVTGLWSLAAPAWTPEPPLARFLEQPGALVVFSFGSMGGRADDFAQLLMATVSRLSCRVIVQGGWAGLAERISAQAQAAGLAERLLCIGYAPHAALFAHASCVVHHGGAGTTAAALQAGVPAVIVWHMLDQPYWGQRLASLGLGPAPLARRGLSAAALAERIDSVLSTPVYRQRCQRVQQQLASERGVAVAIEEITAQLAECRSGPGAAVNTAVDSSGSPADAPDHATR